MRILHSADWHIGELPGPVINGQNARLQDTLRCIDFIVEYANRDRPDVILIAGDLFDKSKLWADNMLLYINEAVTRLRALAHVAPVYLLFGTDNHDNPQAFENIRNIRLPNITVITAPGLITVNTNAGLLQIGSLPGFDKGVFRAMNPGVALAPAEESLMCSQLLGDMVSGLSAQLDPSIPSVLMAHYTVVGCELDNGQHVFTQSEVVLPREALAGSAFDLVALGHIHRAQSVECAGKPVFYSGPVNGITFNEEGQDKGFWMHEISEAGSMYYQNYDFTANSYSVKSEFIKTPSRKFWTTTWNDVDVQEFLDRKWPMNPDYIEDKIIRIRYTCTDELAKQLNHKTLERALYDAGAFYVSEIKPERITTALAKQELTETSGPLENLHAWLATEGFTPEDITPILELAKPLIATISAKMPTGTLSGVFEPRNLTVKNYRSYIEESFNFGDIYFATVNGRNGIGKSSFFMDAIRDCLFEETRTGIIGSWITTGQTDGMITFEFSMGETEWRVIRSRSIKGSGKIALSLQEHIGEAWENRSGTTAKETQTKIEALLGMDCATFSCTALIMQDAYGLFMEADKEARMGVLANILGLSIYERLTDLTKVKVAELNKSLVVSKAKLAELDERLKDKTPLEFALGTCESDLEQVTEDITAKEAKIKIAEELVRTLKTKAEKAQDLQLQMKVLEDEVFAKQREIGAKRQSVERAQKIIASEAAILMKTEELKTVENQILVLETKKPQLQELIGNQARIANDLTVSNAQIKRLMLQIAELEKVLASKTELDEAAEEYKTSIVQLQDMDALSIKESEMIQLTLNAQMDLSRNADEIRFKESKLDELTRKAAMLNNANCIDPENAKCAFLADAQKAKTEMPAIEQAIVGLKATKVDLVMVSNNLDARCKEIGYNREVHDDIRKLVNSLRPKAELAGQLVSKVELLKGLNEQLHGYADQSKGFQARIIELTDLITALNAELAPLPELTERLPKLLQWASAKDELPAAKQIVLSTEDVIRGIEADIACNESKVATLEEEKLVIAFETMGLPTAEMNANKFHSDFKSLRYLQLDYSAKIGSLKSQLEALAKDEAELLQLNAEMAPTAKSLTNYQTLTRAFGLDGIPFSIVRSVVPELSYMANDILGQMTSGKMASEIRLDKVQKSNKKEVNALEVWLTDFRGSRPYGDYSGGEKVKAALANAFALADLKARRVGIMLGMMFIDEPPFLDSEGSEAYCDALEGLNYRNSNMRVIAMSHDFGMKARFPQQIEVVDMGDQGSKVRIA